ncbi:HNH endonuclease signature motif containing protein [Metabacillus fastidiosus]|uniref:HNH endonuclease signature motif containing protein n=1 Tax=Metabacillus fastidiosus TaxID=1458 RepID=UPI003D29FC6E
MATKKGIDFVVTKTGCFECISHISGRYPRFRVNGQKKTISRHVYEEMFGIIPNGLVIRHKCDNTKCINPEHLETGTMKENMQDMVVRNRSAKGSRSGKAVLSEHDVKVIKTMLLYGVPNKDIAICMSVGETTILQIKKNETWTHVPWPKKRKKRKSIYEVS